MARETITTSGIENHSVPFEVDNTVGSDLKFATSTIYDAASGRTTTVHLSIGESGEVIETTIVSVYSDIRDETHVLDSSTRRVADDGQVSLNWLDSTARLSFTRNVD